MFEHEKPPPQMDEEVEVIVKKPLRGGNFNMDEDSMLISSWIEITWIRFKEMNKNIRNIGVEFGSTFMGTRPLILTVIRTL
jgi:hypothetical protein